jgi:O-acetyl-ADP-ribose deacetylase (regulator of RNase III)
MNFTIVKANIVDVQADAIVLPANEKLKEGSGTSRAIFEAAGREKLKAECDKKGHCDVGLAIPTPAFDMSASFIIHAVVPKWKGGKHNEYDLLSSAYLTSLNIADVMGCESIAFPLLASGNNGFDRELAFHIAEESIRCFEGKALKQVILVVFGDTTAQFVQSLGYEVTEFHAVQKPVPKTKEVVNNCLNQAGEWLKNPKHREALVELGAVIVTSLIRKKPNVPAIADCLKKFVK